MTSPSNADERLPNADERLRCPVCGKGKLEPLVRTERFEYGDPGNKVLVVAKNVPVDVCANCGEVLSGSEAARVRQDAICRALCLLTPAAIRGIRERYGPSQEEFAKLTGIGKATISRWERGWVLQNRAMDCYLRLLDAETVQVLENIKNHLKVLPGLNALVDVNDDSA